MLMTKERKIAQKEGRPPVLDSQAIQDELFGFLVAGQDTTATAFCWGLKFLTKYADVQHKLRRTIRSSFRGAAERNSTPTAEEIASVNVPYLDAVVEEIPRVATVASATIRKATMDTDILGYHIPKGTDVFLMSNGPGYIMNPIMVDESKRSTTSQASKEKNPPWAHDPAAFDPDRWLERDGSYNPCAGPNNSFGVGPRGCFGRKWAHLELKVLIVCVIWDFELLPTPASLSSWKATEGLTRFPQECFVRLKALC